MPDEYGASVPWRDYVDHRICDLRKQMDERFRAQQEAVQRFSETNQHALDKVNEFRAAMNDATKNFADDKVVQAKFDALLNRISSLEQEKSHLRGQAEGNRRAMVWLGIGLVVLQLIIATALRFLP